MLWVCNGRCWILLLQETMMKKTKGIMKMILISGKSKMNLRKNLRISNKLNGVYLLILSSQLAMRFLINHHCSCQQLWLLIPMKPSKMKKMIKKIRIPFNWPSVDSLLFMESKRFWVYSVNLRKISCSSFKLYIVWVVTPYGFTS